MPFFPISLRAVLADRTSHRDEPGVDSIFRAAHGRRAPEGLARALHSLDASAPARPGGRSPQARQHLIAVLGVPCQADGRPTPALQTRIDLAASLAKTYPKATIVASGAAVQGQASTEADAIVRGLQAAGVSARRIWRDPFATTTLGNVAYIGALLPRIEAVLGRPIKHATIVAEPQQAVRALRLFAVAKPFASMTLHSAPSERVPGLAPGQHYPPNRVSRRHVQRGQVTSSQLVNLERVMDEKRKMLLGW
ncbi:MAG TPA: YdcF family protein [Myxococcota bacterium]|nr:YdcF family protein [Myxococcota bacterium]